jgi:hypothetical protein
MGAQKQGDKYNYEVAAFLKTNCIEFPPLSPLDLRKLRFNPAPAPFLPEATAFKLQISMDLLIEDSATEFVCECKYSEQPRPLSLNSVEVKESLLEFMGLETYRFRQPRTVIYMLIVNMPKDQLEREVSRLKNNPGQLPEYLGKLLEQARRKWSGFKSKIKVKSLLSVLNNLFLIEIDKGKLDEARKDRNFQDALTEIIRDVENRNPNLVPPSLSTKAQIQLRLENEENLVEVEKLGYSTRIDSTIVDQIVEFQSCLQGHLVRATAEELPFLEKCEIIKSSDISSDDIAKTITESINDIIEKRCRDIKYISIFFPGVCEIYFAEVNWASKKVESLFNKRTGTYAMLEKDDLSVNVPPYVSILLITETKRLVNAIIVDTERIDQATDTTSEFRN